MKKFFPFNAKKPHAFMRAVKCFAFNTKNPLCAVECFAFNAKKPLCAVKGCAFNTKNPSRFREGFF